MHGYHRGIDAGGRRKKKLELAVRLFLSGDRDVLGWGCQRCGRKDTTGSKEPDDVRRRKRGCDAPNKSVDFEWAPFPLQRCPYALIDDESPETWEHVRWWEDWDLFRALPFGSTSILDEPAIVSDVLRQCARTRNEIQLERHEEIEREQEEWRRKHGRS